MSDFVIRGGEYPQLPELLKEAAPKFTDSPELRRLDPADHGLPSVVAGAFRSYVERLASEPLASKMEAELEGAFNAIERLASSSDPEVVNTLVVEVFEHLALSHDLLERFYARLGPTALSVYDKWIGAP